MLYLVVISVFFIQTTTILHEIGHAIPVLMISKENVTISLGIDNVRKSFQVWRITIEIRKFNPFTGFMRCNLNNLSKKQKLCMFIGGPLASFLIALITLYLSNIMSNESSQMVLYLSLYNFYQFIVTAIPIIYPSQWGNYGGTSSDGYKVRQLIRN